MGLRAVGLRLVELARANQDARAIEEVYREYGANVEMISDPDAEPHTGKAIRSIYKKTRLRGGCCDAAPRQH